MHIRRIAAFAALLFVPASVGAQEVPTGQLILDNATSMDAELLVDGGYGCTAPAHGSCIVEVTAGVHAVMITFADGDYILSDPIDLPGGMSVTFPVRDFSA